ncbi:MAG: PfkB family carbohydrate kinase, partial [Beijerinckiaceae bacterium]
VGCFPLVQEPVGSTLLALVQQHRAQRIIAYDPNVRLSIEPDIQRWRARFAEFSALADIIKIGNEDFAALFPGEKPEAKAQGWLAAGASLVLFTEGDDGARLFGRNGQARYRPPPVIIADTVGAGDTAMAAMLAWLAEQSLLDRAKLAALDTGGLKKIVTFACNAAAITCSRVGADPPRRDQVTDR